MGAARTTYTWDGENKLVTVASASGTETYTYSAEGLRQRKQTASGLIYYLRDGDTVLNELNSAFAATARYVNFPGQWGGLVSERIVAGSRFYATDLQGHARALLDASQAVTDTLLADAWGVEVAATENKQTVCSPWRALRKRPVVIVLSAVAFCLVAGPLAWDLYWRVPGRVDFALHRPAYEAIVADVKRRGIAPHAPTRFVLRGMPVFARRDDAGSYSIFILTADRGHLGAAGYWFDDGLPNSQPRDHLPIPELPALGETITEHWSAVFDNTRLVRHHVIGTTVC